MADYIVTTRNADGALEERAYTAEDRADLFKKMAADGIAAVKVQEGVAGKKPRKAMKAAPSKYRGLVAATIVVLGTGAALFFLMPKSENSLEEKKDVKRQIKPAIADVAKTNLEVKAVVVKAVVKEEQQKKPKHPGFGKFPVEVDENGDRWIVRNGRRRKVIRGGTVGTSRQLWFNKAENVISALVTVKPGDPIIGFDLDNIKESFAQSLLNKIEFSDEDTIEEKKEKRLVQEAKKNLVAMIKEGGDLETILKEEYGNIMRMYNYRNDLQKELDSLRKKGASVQEMDDYIKAANKILEDRGIENPVRLSAKERFMLKRETRSNKK